MFGIEKSIYVNQSIKVIFQKKKKTSDYNIVIANGEYGFFFGGKNVITIHHGSYYGLYQFLKKKVNLKGKINFLIKGKIQKIASLNTYAVAVSEFCRSILEEDGVKVQRIIPIAVEERFCEVDLSSSSSECRDKVLVVGNWSPLVKGHDIIETLASYIQITLVSNVEPMKRHSNLIFWKGDPIAGLKKASILLHPSRFEGAGIAPLEALAMGVPILMTKTGVGEVIKERFPEMVVDIDDWENASFILDRIKFIVKEYYFKKEELRQFICENYSMAHFQKSWEELIDARSKD